MRRKPHLRSRGDLKFEIADPGPKVYANFSDWSYLLLLLYLYLLYGYIEYKKMEGISLLLSKEALETFLHNVKLFFVYFLTVFFSAEKKEALDKDKKNLYISLSFSHFSLFLSFFPLFPLFISFSVSLSPRLSDFPPYR